ncbi:MAG TPA: nucleotidyl transferase AbiEii/AbiGii toxin family protein [Thermoanaerobaculia bacterium]|nr:nucleotidyl transferase AbiEii/AbiGii toxin family protein [Thermoanaerobaculia bacterium]
MIRLSEALIRVETDLRAFGVRWALIGGLAVAVRAQPRQTWDVDVVLAFSEEAEVDRVVRNLRGRGYRDHPTEPMLQDRRTKRVIGVRLLVPSESQSELIVDLLFASAGVEPEIIAAAELLEVFPGVAVPVVRSGDLLALKVLAGRPKDLMDAEMLLERMSPADLQQTRETLELIDRRGFHQGKDLQLELTRILGTFR